jgi:hypothetical protein
MTGRTSRPQESSFTSTATFVRIYSEVPNKKTPSPPKSSSSLPTSSQNKFVTGVVEWVDPSSLEDNPANWRLHPPEQVQALQESMEAAGNVVPVLLNILSGKLIDGHGRKQACLEKGWPLPVLRVNISMEQERFHLANLDPIAQMAGFNTKRMKEINSSQEEFLSSLKNKVALESLNKKLGSWATLASVGKAEVNPLKQVEKLSKRREVREDDMREMATQANKLTQVIERTDIEFPCDDEWGIPLLLEDGPWPASVPSGTWCKGGVSSEGHVLGVTSSLCACASDRPFPGLKPGAPGGFLSFFTEDTRFSGAYDAPAKYFGDVISKGWAGVMEPDFSIYEKDSEGRPWSLARGLWALYKSRWCLRYWQEQGIPVIPQLRWHSNDSLFLAMTETLPKGLDWLVVHLRASLASRPVEEIEMAATGLLEAYEACQPKGLIFYGDPKLEDWVRDTLPGGVVELVFIQDHANARGNRE